MSLPSLCIENLGFHVGLSVSLAAPSNNVSAPTHSRGKAYVHTQPHSCAPHRPLLVLTVDRSWSGLTASLCTHSARPDCNGTHFYRALCLSEPSAALLTPPHFSDSSPFALIVLCFCRSFDLSLLDLPHRARPGRSSSEVGQPAPLPQGTGLGVREPGSVPALALSL